MFQPKDKRLWDFWTFTENEVLYLFYLTAKRTCNPHDRHAMAHVALATTTDMKTWKDYGEIFAPNSKKSAWDGKTIWTGSVIKKQGLYYFFYTGTSEAEFTKMQRVGLATSSDLINWTRYSEKPLLEYDPKFYMRNNPADKESTAWRDPFVFKHPNGGYGLLITADRKDSNPKTAGTLAYFTSDDLLNWESRGPFLKDEGFGQMEVPQLIFHEGRYYLLMSCNKNMAIPSTTRQEDGTFYFTSHYVDRDFEFRGFLAGDSLPQIYIAKIIEHPQNGQKYLMAWHGVQDEAETIFGDSTTEAVKLEFDNENGCIVFDKFANFSPKM